MRETRKRLSPDISINCVGLVGELKLGTKELTAGDHKFTVEIAGANEKANGRHFAGLDYIRLVPAK